MANLITFSAPFLKYALPPEKNHPRISFREKKTIIDNKYDLYSRIFADGSYMIEGFDFTVSYAPVSGIRYLCILIAITSAEGLIIFVLNNFNALK